MGGILVSLLNPVKNKTLYSSNHSSVTFKLILGSSSPYRAELLQRLRLPFVTVTPNIDESPLASESAADTALRLAIQKAEKVSEKHRDAYVIGCDQVIECLGKRLGKPFTKERAREQLTWVSGKKVLLYSALCLVNHQNNTQHSHVAVAEIHYRELGQGEIDAYLALEPSFDCAGGVKIEGLGISLVEKISCDDPSAIVGLPLISLNRMLQAEGIYAIAH